MSLEDKIGPVFNERPTGGSYEHLQYTRGVRTLVDRTGCSWILGTINNYNRTKARRSEDQLWYFAIDKGAARLSLVEPSGNDVRREKSRVKGDECRGLWYEEGILMMDYENPDYGRRS